MPHTDKIRLWNGVLFLHSGVYKKAVFKFKIEFPTSYPKEVPRITFITDVFHPLVRIEDRELDLGPFYKDTPKNKHGIINVLKFVKNMFLMNSYMKIETSFNPKAGKLFNTDYEKFKTKAADSAGASYERKMQNSDNFVIKFSEFDTVHEKILNNLKERNEESLQSKVKGFKNWLERAWDDL